MPETELTAERLVRACARQVEVRRAEYEFMKQHGDTTVDIDKVIGDLAALATAMRELAAAAE